MQEVSKSYLDRLEFNSIYFEITSKCNGKCSYCYNDSSQKGKHIPVETIIDTMKQAYQINPNMSFVLSGGEPLLHPNFLDVLNFANEHNLNMTVITNASLIGAESFTWALKKCNIQVTLESLNQMEHDFIRGLCSFDNIRNLQKTIPNVFKLKRILRVNLTRKNIEYINEFAEFAIKNEFNVLSFGFIVNQGRGKSSADIIDYEDDREIWTNTIKEIKKISALYREELIVERKNCYPKVGCELTYLRNPSMAVRIDAEGYVFPCLYFFDKQHSMGNIFSKSLRDILKGESFLALVNALLYRENNILSCKQCIWDKQCRKGCPALAYSKHETINEKESCEFLKDTFKKAIKSERLKSKSIGGDFNL